MQLLEVQLHVCSFQWHTAETICFHLPEKSLHRSFYTKELLHREVFTYTQELYTPTCFYTEERLHTDVFLDRRMFTYRHVYTGTSLHTDGLTHRSVYTQAFTQKTQKLLQTDAFTQTSFYTQMRLHRHGFTQM